MKRRILTVILILNVIFPSFRTAAQESRKTQVALSTDLVDWANFGTVNLEAGVSLHQHFSVHAGAK